VLLGREACDLGACGEWRESSDLHSFLSTLSDLLMGIMLTCASCGQYDGQKGVELMLQTIHDEFRRCMQLTGCTSVKDITKNSLARIDADGMLKRL
jgi:hypothetical protein